MSFEFDPPPPEAYGRVTNPERFQVLHTTMLSIITRLETDFDVQREDGYGLDHALEKEFGLALPSIRLIPNDPEAAPLTIIFSDFPGLALRMGRWFDEPFPVCGCDACHDTGETEIQRLTQIVESVIAGRFREISNPIEGCMQAVMWGDDWSRIHRLTTEKDQHHYPQLNWKPWPRRRP